jgi:hypothetical protein
MATSWRWLCYLAVSVNASKPGNLYHGCRWLWSHVLTLAPLLLNDPHHHKLRPVQYAAHQPVKSKIKCAKLPSPSALLAESVRLSLDVVVSFA